VRTPSRRKGGKKNRPLSEKEKEKKKINRGHRPPYHLGRGRRERDLFLRPKKGKKKTPKTWSSSARVERKGKKALLLPRKKKKSKRKKETRLACLLSPRKGKGARPCSDRRKGRKGKEREMQRERPWRFAREKEEKKKIAWLPVRRRTKKEKTEGKGQ